MRSNQLQESMLRYLFSPNFVLTTTPLARATNSEFYSQSLECKGISFQSIGGKCDFRVIKMFNGRYEYLQLISYYVFE
jgi:hypothetical protein